MKYRFTTAFTVEADDLQQAKDMIKELKLEHLLEWQVKPWYPTIQEQVGEFVEGMGKSRLAKEQEQGYMKRCENLFKRNLRVEKKR